jgi:hypothetical protein
MRRTRSRLADVNSDGHLEASEQAWSILHRLATPFIKDYA